MKVCLLLSSVQSLRQVFGTATFSQFANALSGNRTVGEKELSSREGGLGAWLFGRRSRCFLARAETGPEFLSYMPYCLSLPSLSLALGTSKFKEQPRAFFFIVRHCYFQPFKLQVKNPL